MNSRENQIACEVYINEDKDLYYFLEKRKDMIEKELNCKLVWMPLESKKASRVKIIKEADLVEQEKWDDYIEWMKSNAEKFHKVFGRLIKKYKK